MAFSYSGYTGDGKPKSYECTPTFLNGLVVDGALLRLQINAYLGTHPDTQVYVVMHSLGGAIGMYYLAGLVQYARSLKLANGGSLKAMVFLDAPLAGVIDTKLYDTSILARALPCDLPTDYSIWSAVGDLHKIYMESRGDHTYRGVNASVFFSLWEAGKGDYIRNQDIARKAMVMGLNLLVVGNDFDLVYNPDVCHAGPAFPSVQYLGELGQDTSSGGSLWVRSFESGALSGALACPGGLLNNAHHGDVLLRTDVSKAIWETLTGNPVDQLTPVR